MCSLEMKNSVPRSIVHAMAASKTLHVHIEITRLSSVDTRHKFAIVNPEKLGNGTCTVDPNDVSNVMQILSNVMQFLYDVCPAICNLYTT